MKAFSHITLLFVSFLMLSVTGLMAQRTIHGTVFMDGKPAPGVTVDAHKGETTLTDFDGKYEVAVDAKSKWIKFTAVDGTKKKEDVDENAGDKIDCALTGEIPGGDEDDGGSDVILKTEDELIQERNKDYMIERELYYDYYQKDNVKEAYPHWKIIYNKYPAAHINQYKRGEVIFRSLIEKAATKEEKDKLLDELMKMQDKRIKYFGEKGTVFARKADALLKYKIGTQENSVEVEELVKVSKTAYDWLNTSISEEGSESAVSTVVLFMNSTIQLFKLGELPKETVVKNYDLSNKILNSIIIKCNSIIEENKGTAEEIEDAKTDLKNAEEVAIPHIEDQFGKSGAADCEALINIYTPQFEQNNNDAAFIKSMLTKLRRFCDDNELLEKATVRLYQLDPSAEAAFNMAHSYYVKDDIENAKKYYLQAIEQETDKELLANYYFEYAVVLYGKDRNYLEARDMARKAISLDPTLCKAYMLIGDILVAASSTFSSDNFEKGTVYWVAIDYYDIARRYEDCSVDAAKNAAEYRKGFPNKEEGFFRDIQEGKSYKVEGWINETTTARF